MLNRNRLLRLFAVLALIVWCVPFLHYDTTDKSMVRAILLQRTEQAWTVGFLYQSPEPSADTSEAAAEVAFAAAEGQTVGIALSAAEKLLPQTANYRLCDYILLAGSDGGKLLEDCEQLILHRRCGRLAARVLRCTFTCEELSDASEETSMLPQALLQCAKQTAAAPRLYERGEGLALPLLELAENGVSQRDDGVFWNGRRELALTANQLAATQLLTGKESSTAFSFDGETLELSRAVCSLTVRESDVSLRVDCLAKPGAPAVTQAQCEELEMLLVQTANLLWEEGADVLGLSEARILHFGRAAKLDCEKNACPQIRADVRVYTL